MNIDINYIKDTLGIFDKYGRIKNNDGQEYDTTIMTCIDDAPTFKHAIDDIDNIKQNTKLGFKIKQTSMKDLSVTYIDATPGLIERLFELVPQLNGMWKGIKYFLTALIAYNKSKVKVGDVKWATFKNLDENADYCIDLMKEVNKFHLHKYDKTNIEGFFKPTVTWSFFNEYSDGEQLFAVLKKLPCLGTYNGRVVLEFKKLDGLDDYGIDEKYNRRFISIEYDELVNKFRLLKIHKIYDKNGEVIDEEVTYESIDEKDKKYIRTALVDYCTKLDSVVMKKIGKQDLSWNFIRYDDNPTHTDEQISDMIRELWDVKLGGLDARTGTSLTDSYMTMLGWYFSPTYVCERIAGSFYSPASGFGKTKILKTLCDKTDVVYGYLDPGQGSANQFTFARELAKGPDIMQCDDPMQGTEDVLRLVSRLVTNKSAQVEFKGKDSYQIENLNTKILITSNRPLYMKNDSNNFLTQKLFELQTNDMPHCTKKEADPIVNHIKQCDDSEISAFLNKCVKMYNDNPGWIEQHMGLYMSKEDESVMFDNILSLQKLKNNNWKTLMDLVEFDELKIDRDKSYKDSLQKSYLAVCKHIWNHYNDIAKITVCCLPKNNPLFPPGTNRKASLHKCFKYNVELNKLLLDIVSLQQDNDIIQTPTTVYDNWDDIPTRIYDE